MNILQSAKSYKKPEKESINTGHLFIISAPSGTGKTTLCKIILDRFPFLRFSVSFTTRKLRQGEKNGTDYYFITKDEFRRGIEKNQWAEWAQVHGNYYGTSALFLNNALQQGQNLLLDIDVQGASALLRSFPDAVTIFIKPPSIRALETRLKKRKTDSEEIIKKRLTAATQEMAQQNWYRHVVVNDDLQKAVEELIAVISLYIK